MNNRDIEHMWKVASNNPNHDTNWYDPVVIAFANLVEEQEREAWEQKFARLQNLMDVREIQPNKPCCLAARAEEREQIAAWYEAEGQMIFPVAIPKIIRAGGTT